MADRQHGRSRGSSGGRGPGGRTARTVPVGRAPGGVRRPPQPGTPSYTEPEVRRWPHPLEEMPPAPFAPEPAPALHYIRCALSYQNQLLADIKALLEQMAAAAPAAGAEKADEGQPKL